MWGEERARYKRVLLAHFYWKMKCVDNGRRNLVRDGVCVPLQQLAEAVEKAEAALTLEDVAGGVLAGLRGGKGWRHLHSARENGCTWIRYVCLTGMCGWCS